MSDDEFLIARLQTELEEAKRELHLWKVALHDLTAGGSEFANDLGACVAYVRKRYSTQHELAKTAIIAKNNAVRTADELRTENARLHTELEQTAASYQDLGKRHVEEVERLEGIVAELANLPGKGALEFQFSLNALIARARKE